jgi:hypothetical protein
MRDKAKTTKAKELRLSPAYVPDSTVKYNIKLGSL